MPEQPWASPVGDVLDGLVRSVPVWASLAVSGALLLGIYVGPVAGALGVVTPTAAMWTMSLMGGLAVFVVGQVALSLRHLVL